MAKSTIKLVNGTIITVEGSAEEVAKLMDIYGDTTSQLSTVKKDRDDVNPTKNITTTHTEDKTEGKVETVDLVNLVKDADDFEVIEKNILDKASQVDRVLLPMFIVDRKFGNEMYVTSNDIYKFLKEFGINMALPNISKTLSGTAIKYVMANSTRKKGSTTSYKISRKGKQYIEQILSK